MSIPFYVGDELTWTCGLTGDKHIAVIIAVNPVMQEVTVHHSDGTVAKCSFTNLHHLITAGLLVHRPARTYAEVRKAGDLPDGFTASKVCTCGGAKAKTSHSSWCDSL
jgi:hypothetical protein